MSGGSLGEYGFYNIEHAQVDLRYEIDQGTYEPETVAQLEAVYALMGAAAAAWKDADWLVSGDTSESNWMSETTSRAVEAYRQERKE